MTTLKRISYRRSISFNGLSIAFFVFSVLPAITFNRLYMRLFIVIMIALCVYGCASTAKQKTTVLRLDEKEASLKIKHGNLFTIEIPVQAGTGYQWDIAAPPTKCHFIGADIRNDSTGNVGGKEMRIMRFSSSETGSEDVHFILHRAFETDKAPVDEKILHLTVN